MHTRKLSFICICLLITSSLVIEAAAQENRSTTVTLPGGFTVTTTSLIVGIIAVIAVAAVGVIYAARRISSGNTSNVQVFQNNQETRFTGVNAEARTSSDNMNTAGGQTARSSPSVQEKVEEKEKILIPS